jgi:microsomal prostaglandin-E synthase 2
MRRASTLLLSRTILPGRTGSAAAINYGSLHAALYGTTTDATRSRWFSTIPGSNSTKVFPIAIAGAMVSFAGATLISQEAYAKEAPPPEFAPKEVVIYQYDACPFCNKVKAFLDYYDVPYKVIEVNPLSKKEIKFSDYKKVPILMVDGEQLNDSSAIIDKLADRFSLKKQSKGAPAEDDEETKWRKWVDNHLVHMLSPNMYRNTSEALEAFDYITSNGNFSTYEKYSVKYAGAAAMYFVSKKLKKKYNITDERASLYDAAETWVKALDGRDYLGGSKPNLADLAVFGVLRPIRYLRSGKDMVEHTGIGEWYSRMEIAVGESKRIKEHNYNDLKGLAKAT